MITVIIAGGSGTRLWPLSTPNHPKHLLALTGTHSLLRYSYDRAITISDHVYVVPEISHAEEVKKLLPQLPDDAFIVEPARRGTANCIVAALSAISKKHSASEPIAFLAADHYIRDTAGFTHSFKIAEKVSKNEGRIVLVGVEPNYPATGFGYIEKDGIFDEKSFVFNVRSFKEKPDFNTAKKYLESGNYLWNCSYFVGSCEVFLKNMKAHAPHLHTNYERLRATTTPEEYEKTYLNFESDTIDYALIEKTKDLLVVPASFDWMDLGSFNDLHKIVETNQKGNHVYGKVVELEEVENSFIHNNEDKPLAVIGLDNIIVVNTPDGLLVARKDISQKVGDVSKRFK